MPNIAEYDARTAIVDRDSARMAELDEQIRLGWGDTPGHKIPSDWRECKPVKAGNLVCPECDREYTLWRSGGRVMCHECWVSEPGVEYRREVQRKLYQRRRLRPGYLDEQAARHREYWARMKAQREAAA